MSAATRIRQASSGSIVVAVAALMLALFLVALDQTIVGTALPKIIADLEGFDRYSWVTTSYLLASTATIPIIGKLGDLYGRKWFIVAGVVVFLIGSALCGAAWGMTELILFRGVQGLGAGMIFSNLFTSIADIFPDPARRAKYQGVFFAVFSLSSVVGPALGGWITDNFSWRWVFFVNLPLGLFSLVVLPIVLQQGQRRLGAKIDFLGAATITASVSALLLALSWVGEGDAWDAPRVVLGFIVAGVLLVLFIPIELRAAEPVIPLTLFKSRVFTTSAILMFLVGIGMFGIILYTPLFVQGALGKSATGSGTVLTPLVLAMTFVGILGGQIIARVRLVKPFTIFGTVVMTFGVYLLTTLDVGTTQTTVALYLAVTGLGLGLIMPTATLAVQNTVEKRLLGVATSATQFVRSVGSTVGVATIGSIVTKGYADKLDANAPAGAPERLVRALDNPQALVSDGARRALEGAVSAVPGGEQILGQVIQTGRNAISDSIHEGFVFTLVCTAAAIVVALLMKNVRLVDPAAQEAAASKNGKGEEMLTGVALEYLARRIESADGEAPNLIRAASALVPDAEGTEKERASLAARTVLRPMALRKLQTGVGAESGGDGPGRGLAGANGHDKTAG